MSSEDKLPLPAEDIESLVNDFGRDSAKATPEDLGVTDFSSGVIFEDSAKFTPEAHRRLFRTRTAGFLALGLWLIFGFVILWHVLTIRSLSEQLLLQNSSSIEEQERRFDKATALVGDTAKTLYAILGGHIPLLR